jgi:membrane associated rhomboid family serine protease
MGADDFSLMAAIFAATCAFAAWFARRGGDARRDVALLGASGAAFGSLAAVLYAF